MEEVGINHRSQQVISSRDGMNVTVKVQVDFGGRFDRRCAASRRASLHAKDRTQRRLARGDDGLLSDTRQPLGQTDRGDRFSFATGCRRGRRYDDQLTAPWERCVAEQVEPHFPAVRANLFEIFFGEF